MAIPSIVYLDVDNGQGKQTVRLSHHLRRRLNELLLVLVTAVVFSFLMGILASTLVNSFVDGVPITRAVIFTITSIVVVVGALVGLVYRRYVFSPNAQIERELEVPILYNRNDRRIIDDPFDGYYPQKMAWQAFERLMMKDSQCRSKLKEGISPEVKEKHILVELFEYLVVLTLSHQTHGFGEKGLMPDKKAEIPAALKRNTFISFFQRLESRDIIDRGMAQLNLELPADFALKFISPIGGKHRVADSNTFQIELAGNCCDIILNAYLTSMWPVQSMTCGPAPIFEGVRIRHYFQQELARQLGSLWRVTFKLRVRAKFKMMPFVLGRFLGYDPYVYMDWAQGWITRITSGDPFCGFNFEEVAATNKQRREDETHEIVRFMQAGLDEVIKSLEKLKKDNGHGQR
jgi:hypothetical protein